MIMINLEKGKGNLRKGKRKFKELTKQELMFQYPKLSHMEKLGNIPCVNMPRIITCRCNAPCIASCYAGKGKCACSTAQMCYLRNLEVFNSDSKYFFNKIISMIQYSIVPYFRWHSVGDIVNEEYLDGMCRVARKCKKIKFLCFTKKYELCDLYFMSHKKPKNLTIIYSCWFDLVPENPHGFPMCFVYNKEQPDWDDIFKGLYFPKGKLIDCKYNSSNGGCPACIANEKKNCWCLTYNEAVTMALH